MTQIQLRRDTAANWVSSNPVLASGELGLDTTNSVLKVGNGSTAWNSLGTFAAPDATTGVKGLVQLAGDLAGTAAAPTVPGLSGKANTVHTHVITDTTNLQSTLDSKPTLWEGGIADTRLHMSPESSHATFIPYFMNDIAFNILRGGACRFYKDGVQDTGQPLDKLFNPTADAVNIATSGITTMVFEVDLYKTFTYSTKVGFAVTEGFRAKNFTIEFWDINTSAWVTAATSSNYNSGEYITGAIGLTGGGAVGTNKLRYTFSNWNSTSFRMGNLFLINYSSPLGAAPFVTRDGGNVYGPVYGVTPTTASELTRKDYVDAQDATRVPVGTGNTRAYIRDGSGAETTIGYSSSATASTIMFRTTGGVTSVGEPTSSSHAATKNYVDTTAELVANKGAANGYAPLDAGSKVPSANLPSYVDDVLEYTNLAAFPATGTTGLIYVALDTNKIYRWSGSAYVEISPSPGSTDSVTEGSTNKYFTDVRAQTALTTQLAGKVDTTRTVSSGTGLTGGGDLSANRTLAVSYGTSAGTAAQGNDSRITGAVQNTRTLTAGTGLTGGGDLTADRTFAVSYGTSSTTACVGNDARLSDTRTPATGTQFYDPTINGFAATTVRAAGAGDFPMGVKLQRAVTFTSVTFRVNTADASGNLVVELRKNGSTVSGTSTTIAAASQVAGGTSTGSWAFAAGDILTVYITAVGTTPGTGLVADLKGTA